MKFLTRSLQILVLCVALPLELNFIAYGGYNSRYTDQKLYTEQGFRAQYSSGIYRYRILGPRLLLMTNKVLRPYMGKANTGVAGPKGAELSMYLSYFLLNTFFMGLTMFALCCVCLWPDSPVPISTRYLCLLAIAGIMAITQFVIVPYDMLAYFLLVVGVGLTLRHPTWPVALFLLATVVLAALTRETVVLMLSAYAASCVVDLDSRWQRRRMVVLVLLALAFAATYVGTRLAYGWDQAVIESYAWQMLTNPVGIISVCFAPTIIGILLAAAGGDGRRTGLFFLLFSIPYILGILMAGIPFELRLWVPLMVALVPLVHAHWPVPPEDESEGGIPADKVDISGVPS